jgi:hypothetical protein
MTVAVHAKGNSFLATSPGSGSRSVGGRWSIPELRCRCGWEAHRRPGGCGGDQTDETHLRVMLNIDAGLRRQQLTSARRNRRS